MKKDKADNPIKIHNNKGQLQKTSHFWGSAVLRILGKKNRKIMQAVDIG